MLIFEDPSPLRVISASCADLAGHWYVVAHTKGTLRIAPVAHSSQLLIGAGESGLSGLLALATSRRVFYFPGAVDASDMEPPLFSWKGWKGWIPARRRNWRVDRTADRRVIAISQAPNLAWIGGKTLLARRSLGLDEAKRVIARRSAEIGLLPREIEQMSWRERPTESAFDLAEARFHAGRRLGYEWLPGGEPPILEPSGALR